MRKKLKGVTLFLGLSLLLSGCGSSNSQTSQTSNVQDAIASQGDGADIVGEQKVGTGNEQGASVESETADVKFPDSIQLIVASTAGGFADGHARIVANYLQEKTGSSVAVVNQADGGGVIAYDTVKTAKPDGSTLLFYHKIMGEFRLSL